MHCNSAIKFFNFTSTRRFRLLNRTKAHNSNNAIQLIRKAYIVTVQRLFKMEKNLITTQYYAHSKVLWSHDTSLFCHDKPLQSNSSTKSSTKPLSLRVALQKISRQLNQLKIHTHKLSTITYRIAQNFDGEYFDGYQCSDLLSN